MTADHAPVDPRAIQETIEAVKADPQLAAVTFSLDSEWMGGFRARSSTGPLVQGGTADDTRTGAFVLTSDEPAALLGSDSAASPGEYALKALAACYAVTFAANAASAGIVVDSLQLELKGDFDLHGFLGLDPTVRPGMQRLDVAVSIESSNASREQLQSLVETVESRSPIRDTLANPVTVTTSLK